MDLLFLTLDEVLDIHAQQVDLYGRSGGVRDLGALESAVVAGQPPEQHRPDPISEAPLESAAPARTAHPSARSSPTPRGTPHIARFAPAPRRVDTVPARLAPIARSCGTRR